MIFCTQLTFDLFLRLRSNYRLGIHPYVFCHISRNNISMSRIMYSILPSKVKISVFFPMGLPTIWVNIETYSCYIRNPKAPASFCSCVSQFESYLLTQLRQVVSRHGSYEPYHEKMSSEIRNQVRLKSACSATETS